MKLVLLAGGYGTRISEESHLRPKPMVEIGSLPIILHIMKYYSTYGIKEFIICLGYKGYVIKEYFNNYFIHNSDLTINLSNDKKEVLVNKNENWKITLIDTGIDTMTGGRLKRVRHLLDDTFLMTYSDGLSDIDISELIKFHKSHKKLATLTAVSPPSKYGSLIIDNNEIVSSFQEKPKDTNDWINGGYFVLEPGVFDYIDNDFTIWEKEPLQDLSKDKNLFAFKHKGFWQPMDTLREKNQLNEYWKLNKAPWKKW